MVGTGSSAVNLADVMVAGVAASKIMVGTGSAAVEVWTAFTPVSLSDNFNRADGYVTSPWTSYGSSPYLPYIDTNRVLTYGNTTDGTRYAHARHATPMASDEAYVKSTIVSTNNTWPSWVFLGSNSATTDRVNLRWIDDTLDIVRVVGGVETSMASGTSAQAVGKVFELRVVGKVYTGYVNGVAVSGLSWNDTGNTIARDASHRYVGFGGTSRRAAFTSSWSPILDDWAAGDL